MTATAGNSNRFVSRRKFCQRLLSSGDGAPIFALLGWAWQVSGHSCCRRIWPHLAATSRAGGPWRVARQSLDSVIHHLERRYVEVERLDDLYDFPAIIEKGSQAA